MNYAINPGAGLPIYTRLEHQHEFTKGCDAQGGAWGILIERSWFPAWQMSFRGSIDINIMHLVHHTGGTEEILVNFVVPFSTDWIEKICTDDNRTWFVFKKRPTITLLECNELYYFRFEMSDGSNKYSEKFRPIQTIGEDIPGTALLTCSDQGGGTFRFTFDEVDQVAGTFIGGTWYTIVNDKWVNTTVTDLDIDVSGTLTGNVYFAREILTNQGKFLRIFRFAYDTADPCGNVAAQQLLDCGYRFDIFDGADVNPADSCFV